MLSLVEAVAPADSTVLILGESGTGKELVARALHERSRRSSKPFMAVNCGALAESVLESELFGHVRGAFTGAVTARKGLFEEASGGTLFLDEVGEMPLSIQVRLLRVLEEREVRPVGSNETRKVDVRLIAATNRNLVAATRAGAFREDLFYRLNVVSIETPALRDRASDIPLLAHHFLALYAKKLGKSVKRIEPDALEILCAYKWPGMCASYRMRSSAPFSWRKTTSLPSRRSPRPSGRCPRATGCSGAPTRSRSRGRSARSSGATSSTRCRKRAETSPKPLGRPESIARTSGG